ncbi:FtsX-like permease family protein [Streptococcus sp. zg-86]|uniref:FtsX-like permease family protein n=1 Tax=Streptococcus zhangguiae TaxID=2664091 RepID=A0A6I4RRT7_9STRE|nr:MULTISPECIES: ABC transporter permease [unclassified Streptococcus]MTB64888.1 FtsX-like permease family protein [Streptococcus sp. zg-86]MTB91042.1 FtsX-like permease family protein [Streptococcus sp. zg-36]MWV56875.1 FtsX-like permease family protein [Streptococcus sp. zg-70]QTH48323.1 ABC transporter permease [Streptococcus sp. zg-86]
MWKVIYTLAGTNLLKNRKLYYPFALVTALSATIAYLFTSLSHNPHLAEVYGAKTVTLTLQFGQYIVLFTVAMMLLYANGFVMKNRSKELGIYTVLGLEKGHLLLMTLVETILFSLVTVGFGLIFGVILDKLIYAILLKTMHVKVVLVSVFQWSNALTVILYFLLIFFGLAILNAGTLSLSSSLQLVKGQKRGEAKGRFLLLQTLLGLGILVYAYYLSLSVESPIKALPVFFTAVVLVIVATYILFHAGIISFLKWLQRRESYYYQPANFISVSNLVFRMRKNAMGLATIAILSTMFIITMIGGINIYVGGNDMIQQLEPNDFTYHYQFEKNGETTRNTTGDEEAVLKEWTSQNLEQNGVPISKMVTYTFFEGIIGKMEKNQVKLLDKNRTGFSFYDINVLYVFDEASYKGMTGERLDLSSDQVAVYSKNVDFDAHQPIVIGEQSFTVKKRLPKNFTAYQTPNNMTQLFPGLILVVHDLDDVSLLTNRKTYIGVDTSLTEEEQMQRWENWQALNPDQQPASLTLSGMGSGSRVAERASTFAFTGSLFFIGIFLSVVFLMATVLVIYYKQISEAYEDRERFVIMQKVGLDEGQTKQSIRKQMATVFFLPLSFAFLHLAFAYKVLSQILLQIGIINSGLVLQVALWSCFGYFTLYLLVYLLTARSYRSVIRSN